MTEQINEFLFPILFDPINSLFRPDPRYVLSAVFILFALACWKMKHLTHPLLWLIAGGLTTALFVVGLVNPDFQLIIFKADNVPIIILLATVGFFTWWGLRQGVLNDEYKAKAPKNVVKESNTVDNDPEDKVHTFPFLVHPEFISTIVSGALLTTKQLSLTANGGGDVVRHVPRRSDG